MTDSKLTVVWLKIGADSADKDTTGLGLAQVGQHAQNKTLYCRLVTIVVLETGRWKLSALVQLAVIPECTESALTNPENGALVSAVVVVQCTAGYPACVKSPNIHLDSAAVL